MDSLKLLMLRNLIVEKEFVLANMQLQTGKAQK